MNVTYDVQGTGSETLVLVHGWSCDRSYWRSQVAPLAERFRVVTVDLGGHGASGANRTHWTIEAFGDDVTAVAQDLDLDRVVLIGHSMGGDVVVEAALKLAQRTLGVVWVDTYKRLGTPESSETIRSFVDCFRADFRATTRSRVSGMFPVGADRSLVEWVADDMSSAPPSIAVASLEASMSYGRTVHRRIADLGVPVWAINSGSGDTDHGSMRRYGVEVVVLEEVGHFPMLEDPSRFTQTLVNVVAAILGDATGSLGAGHS